ncbi:probable L-type lectin-domain containing receptor kinase VII.2 isoform X2 [Durio zibethinus]|uniref:non-specific serine/threonine protein kinase n=1 Tax=Durio zibethinus TaxID=66656 RepID=A0A6P5XDI3_DURZI|nr:probable L-type lectin-domain containing receptor kinase VII.2 isoform X2 [Durio zibethinus]
MSPRILVLLVLTAITLLLLFASVSSVEFVYNTNFNSANLVTFGDAAIDSSILSITNDSTFSVGRALYPLKIPVKSSNSSEVLTFSTSFIFSIAPLKGLLPGHGFAFAFLPSAGIAGASSSQHLGLFNFTSNENSVFQSIGFIIGVTVGAVLLVSFCIGTCFLLVTHRRKRSTKKEEVEHWELEYWPHRIGYQEISAATKAFSDENVIGSGANGNVYKGVLTGGLEVAVKKISHESKHAMREFLAEVSSLGRLKHRNLVGLIGWCRNDKGSLILVYDYMQNGSVDKRIFYCDEHLMLSWDERIKVLKDVASGIWYLHEGSEAKVLHRDIKASNVLLDKDMNARLGDFGLARMHHHGELASTTRVVGTVGYMAPEVIRTGRASTQTDVFCFGVLILEIVCGRRPIEEGKPALIDWAWGLMERQELIFALDDRLKAEGGYTNEEVERMLRLGLLCAHPEPHARPTMRQVMKLLEEGAEHKGEGVELNLLDRMRTTPTTMWRNFSTRGHPTFNEIQRNLSSSMSMSNSDIILEGR